GLLASARAAHPALSDAAAEPGHTEERADRPPRARARVREPRLPARRERADPAPLQRSPLDRVPARVPRLAPVAADAARPVHGALLPRRGDGLRGRPSAVRALPA